MKKIVSIITLVALLSGCSLASTNENFEEIDLPVVSEESFKTALSRVDVSFDEFEETTNYNIDSAKELINKGSTVNLSVAVDATGEVIAFLSASYYGDDWIFFESVDVRVKGETVALLPTGSFDKAEEVFDGGKVYESGLTPLDSKRVGVILKVLDDTEAKFRLSGGKGTIDADFGPTTRSNLQTMLTIYLGLKQGFQP